MEKVFRFRIIGGSIVFLGGVLVVFFVWKFLFRDSVHFVFDTTFLLFVLAGFVAQMIDGALGMAYGVSCSSFLLGFGLSPAVVSASVHTAEVFSTAASGLSHLYFRNVDKKLFFKILIPGIAGAMLGAYLISNIFDGNSIKPYVSGYLFILGMLILYKGIRRNNASLKPIKNIWALGFSGGLLDMIGGGGWGPIVASNLIHRGKAPKEVIGTVNTAEFFVTFFGTGVFLFLISISIWQVIFGLIVGSVIAAPFGAWLVKIIKTNVLMCLVGILVLLMSALNLAKAFGEIL